MSFNSFSVLSYNILVPHWAHMNKPCFKEAPEGSALWHKRCGALVNKATALSPDIVCMQEVERYRDIKQKMQLVGYRGINTCRNNGEEEGCCTFYKKDVFAVDNTNNLFLMIALVGWLK